MTQILMAPFVLVVPGWALAVFVVKRPAAGALRWVLMSLYLSLLSLSVISLVLLAVGLFRPMLVFGCQMVLGVAASVVALTRQQRPKVVMHRTVLATVGAAVCVGIAFSLWGSREIALGGRDPGTYLASGALLKEGAGVSFGDPLWEELTPKEREVFTHWDHGIAQRHPGFYLHGPDREGVKLEVLPLYPCWEALSMELAGIGGAMRLNTYLAGLSLLALAVLGLEIGGPLAGALAPLLLGVSLPQVYFSRVPSADIAAQVLVLGALASHLTARRPPVRALLSGAGLGLALFAHPGVWVLMPGVVAYAVLWDRSVARRWFATIAPCAILAALEMTLHRWEYVPSRLAKLHFGQGDWSVLALVVAVAAAAWLVAGRVQKGTAARTRVVLAAVVVAFAVWGYFFRPALARTIQTGGKVLPNWDRLTLRCIAAYVSPLVFWLGVIEAARRLAKSVGAGALCPAVLVPHLLVFGYRQMVHPDHPWAARRFLVAVFPLLALMAALFMGSLWAKRGTRARVAVILTAGASLWWTVWTSRPVLGLHEAAGVTETLRVLGSRFGRKDIVVVEGSRVGYLLSVPLQYLLHKQVVLYKPEKIGRALALAEATKRWADDGKKVFYLSPWPVGASPIGGVALQSLDRIVLTTTTPRTSWSGPPRGRETLTLPLYIHRFATVGDHVPATYAALNVGEDDFGRVEGFYGPELAAGSGEVYRWTMRRATLLFPPLGSAGPLRLTLRLSAPRSRGGNPLVKLFVSGEPLGELRPGTQWAEYVVEVPRADPTKATVSLHSDVWNPLHDGFSNDDRFLGVRVDWVRLEALE